MSSRSNRLARAGGKQKGIGERAFVPPHPPKPGFSPMLVRVARYHGPTCPRDPSHELKFNGGNPLCVPCGYLPILDPKDQRWVLTAHREPIRREDIVLSEDGRRAAEAVFGREALILKERDGS